VASKVLFHPVLPTLLPANFYTGMSGLIRFDHLRTTLRYLFVRGSEFENNLPNVSKISMKRTTRRLASGENHNAAAKMTLGV
jgi:hypothetical protein